MTSQSVTNFTWASGSSTSSGTTNPIVVNSNGTSGPYAATVFGSIAVVGSPTVAAQFQVQESPDGGTTWYSAPTKLYAAGLTAGSYYFEAPIDPTATSVRLVYTQQTGGTSSTFAAQLGQITGI